jgi:DNA polymerase-1
MTALLLDTYSLFFRAFHALPPMNTVDGTPTSAVYGLSALLIKLLREHAPEGVAFALDGPEQTQRAREFAGYKQNRAKVPDALPGQFALLDELIAALGLPAWRVPGFEADDVLATLAGKLGARGKDVLIVSGDRDSLQLVRERTHVLFVGRRGGPPERYDRAAVLARFGVQPEQLPAYVALVGDPADNLPKVPGIGPKIASGLIAAHGSTQALLAALPTVANARVRQLLSEHRDQILQSERLARLHDDLELECDPDCVAALSTAALDRLRAFCDRYEFKSLVPRLEALRALITA